MRKLSLSLAALALLGSPALAQSNSCRTDEPNCRGFTDFGPAGVDRCISIRGNSRTDFCQTVGESRRVQIQPGEQYCAVLGTTPVPDQCDLHWINVIEPN